MAANMTSQEPNMASVLIVDDNDAVRFCLQEMFTTLGYNADVAEDGIAALPKLVERDYAAVVCDLAMPGMTGDQLYAACRHQRAELASRFIFITGDIFGLTANFLNSVTQPHLAKPFRISDIEAALSEVVA
jgi:CheY-like chemotaxis protein